MREIRKPSAFKTCYIAHVKEMMGMGVSKAHNRMGKRKHPVPRHLLPWIKGAIEDLQKKGERLTYKKIQERAFELYREHREKALTVCQFKGIFKDNPETVVEIAEAKDLSYED